jgi:hypothetical protein
MLFSTAFIALAAPLLVSAAPIKRAAAGDLAVLQFADVLEPLESTFYAQALQKFKEPDFLAAGFSSAQIPIQQFTQIGGDEATHSTVLQAALSANGAQPVTGCNFDFSSVLTDVTTMAATARLVENVGVGAYLGAASLIADPSLLTAAASILTVEARHQTMLNVLNGATAIPQAFDIALTPPQVLALAGPFISGCDLGVTPNPSLAVTNTGPIQPGTSLTFQSAAINGTVPEGDLFCQMLIGGAPTSISLPFNQCVVPDGINGPVAIFVTSDSQPLAADVITQATNSIVAGPTMAFIDTQPDFLAQTVNTAAANSTNSTSSVSSVPPSTTTITPAQASAAIASAPTITLTNSKPSPTGSSASATPTASGAPASGAVAAAPADSAAGSPIGPSPDGNVVVNGWSNLAQS